MTMQRQLSTILAAALLAAAGVVFAQPATEKKAPPGKALMDKPQFDVYEPSKRLRTRRQACMNDEVEVDAWCAKKCQTGYQMEFSGNQAKCRSLTPLPPGVFPGPARKQTGVQPKLPQPNDPVPRKPGA
jgi:hypothetical protein